MSDSASGFAIMKKQHLSSIVTSSMYFHVFLDKLLNKLLWLFCLFVFPEEIAFSSILRNELHTWRAWYNGSNTIMANSIKTLELHYPMIQFLINIYI